MPEWLTTTIVVSWIASGILGGIVGAQKDAGVYGFFLGIIFGPLGVVAALSLDGRPKCPACTGRLNGRARVCPCCHAALVWIRNSAGELRPVLADEGDEFKRRVEARKQAIETQLQQGHGSPQPLTAASEPIVSAAPVVAPPVVPSPAQPPLPVPPKRAATIPGRNPAPPRRA